jgi:hypothetical protein
MPEGLLARRRREHRERRYGRCLLTVGADPHVPHVPTSRGWDHQDRRRIEALFTEISWERRRRWRGLHLPDLRDAEGETAARLGRPGPGLLTRAPYHMQIDHPSSSSGVVAPGAVGRSSRDRAHARPGTACGRTPVQAHPSRQASTRRDPGPAARVLAGCPCHGVYPCACGSRRPSRTRGAAHPSAMAASWAR